jgi:hypothetical protein
MVWVLHDLVENTPESGDGTVAVQVRQPVRSAAAQVGVHVGGDNKGFDLRHYLLHGVLGERRS